MSSGFSFGQKPNEPPTFGQTSSFGSTQFGAPASTATTTPQFSSPFGAKSTPGGFQFSTPSTTPAFGGTTFNFSTPTTQQNANPTTPSFGFNTSTAPAYSFGATTSLPTGLTFSTPPMPQSSTLFGPRTSAGPTTASGLTMGSNKPTAAPFGTSIPTTGLFTIPTSTVPGTQATPLNYTLPPAFGVAQPTMPSMSFGSTAPTGMFGGTTSAAPNTGLSFGTPQNPAPKYSFGPTTTSVAAPLSFGAPQSSAPATVLNFSTPASSAPQPGLSFAPASANVAPTMGLTFGLPASTAPSTGLSFTTVPSTNLSFGTSVATTAPPPPMTLNFSMPPPSAPTTSLNFATPAATVPSLGLGFATPASAATGLSFSTPAPPLTTAAATNSFGISAAATQITTASSVPTLTFAANAPTTTAPTFAIPITSTTPAALNFGAPTTSTVASTAATSGSLSFGGISTAKVATTGSLPSFGLASQPTAAAPHAAGLGGISSTPPKQTATTTTGQNEVPPKDQLLPNELLQTVEQFKKFVQEQKNFSSEIARFSIKDLRRVEDDVQLINNCMNEVENELRKNKAIAEKLKMDTAKDLQHIEMAQRTFDTPAGLQYENTAPFNYFLELSDNFEKEMLDLKTRIENVNKHILNSGAPVALSSQDLALGMRRLHETFVTLAGRLQSVHSQVELQKEQYLNLRKIYLNDYSNVFEKQNKESDALEDILEKLAKQQPSITASPTPFNSLRSSQVQAVAQNISTGYSTPSTLGPPITTGLNVGPTPTMSLFGSSITSTPSIFNVSASNAFQLQKPPVGNKRGKP